MSSNTKQDQIIAAAQQVFAEMGFRKVTLDDVAQKLNMTRTGLYYYYKNKEELFGAVLEYEIGQYSLNLEKILESKGDTLKSLSLFCSQYARLKRDFMNMYKLTIVDVHSNFEVFKSLRIKNEKVHSGIIERILRGDTTIPASTDLLKSSLVLSQALKGLVVTAESSNVDEVLARMNFLCTVFYHGLKHYRGVKKG